MFFSRSAVLFFAVILSGSCCGLLAQSPTTNCSAIIARPNQQLGGANLAGFLPWGGKSDWTRDISADPVDPSSATWVASVVGTTNPYLMPDQVVNTVVVTGGQTRVDTPITTYPSVSDLGPYPIPLPPLIQGTGGTNYSGTGDRHLTIIDKDSCVLYELYATSYDPTTKAISAGLAAVYDLQSGDHQRPYLWSGGSVSGLPWSYNALRYDEVASGQINHALTFAARNSYGRSAFTDMATSAQYGQGNQTSLPPFGARARLRADFDISSFSPRMQVVLQALKQYGMVYIDGSLPIDFHVEVDDRWDTQELKQLNNVFFSGNFDFIQTGPIYNDPMYGAATAPPTGPPPSIASFTASSASVAAGTPVTLAWSVSGAGSRVRIITPGVGPVTTDSVVVTPAATTTYTIAAENVYGRSTKTVTVTVTGDCVPGLPAVTVSPATQNLDAGQAASILVSVANTDSSGCVAESFPLSHTLPYGWTGAYSSPTVTIAPGASATATLTVVAPNDGARGDTPITAAVSGMAGTSSQTANIFFTPQQSLKLSLSSSQVGGGKPVTGTVTLVDPAPAGGAVVALSTSSAVASVPASVTIAEGAYSANFTVTTTAVSATVYVSVGASYAGLSQSITLRVDPAALWFIGIASKTMIGGTSTANNNVFMTGAVVTDTAVTMSSSDPTAATPQATVTIPANATQAPFTITTYPVTTTKTVTITATYLGVSSSQTITVTASAPPVLSSMTLTPSTMTGGSSSSQNTVSLSAAAVANTVVTLSSGNPAVTVPASVTIPTGAVSTTFTTKTSAVDASVNATISASYSGVVVSQVLTVVPPSIATVSLSPNPIAGGATGANNTISLNGPAGSQGVVVTLTSANPAVAAAPASVTIAPGASQSPYFSIATASVSAPTTVAITATYGASSATAVLTVNPPALASLSISPNPALGGTTLTNDTVGLDGPAGASGAVVALTSANPSLASVPATVTIPAGTTAASFAIATAPVSASTTVAITASLGGVTKTVSLTLNPPSLQAIAVSPSTIAGGNQSSTNTVTLNGPAGSAGASVALKSSSKVVSVPATVNVPAGAASAAFTISASAVSSPTTVTITATYGGVSKTATVTVNPAGLASIAVQSSIQSGTSSSANTVFLDGAVATGTTISLKSSSSALSVPGTVSIAKGGSKASFTMKAGTVAADQVVTITATYNGKTVSATTTVLK